MRCWITITLLAGCYRPSESLCDGERLCVREDAATDAIQHDGGSDADPPKDVQPLTTCVDSSFEAATLANVQGTSYSRNVSSFALLIGDTGELQQIISPGGAKFAVTFASPPTTPLTRPVLASSTQAGEVHAFFVQGTKLVRSTYNSGNLWNAPVVISTTGITLDASFVLGQPTVTIPRRAVASSNGGAFEAIENGTSWDFAPVTIPGVGSVLHPSLSNDGLAVVFVAKDTTDKIRLFLAERATVTAPFETATALLDQPTGIAGNEEFPRFGPDCDHIFLSIEQSVIDVH